MEILLNNRSEHIDRDEISLSELIKLKNFTFKLLVTKVNGKLVKKDARDTYFIRHGDEVSVLHMISGG
ncbi:MAG: sulfur carrier protein ThiS [Bacteroidales bacterium]|jgi:thiamine biosynthesis protein ThiS|nr:sulfur carrier protein ThiS [Bacteroidales bacterium]